VTTRYRYRAATPEGRVVEGLLEATSRTSLLDELHRRRLYPMVVDQVAATTPKKRRFQSGRRGAVTLWARDTATLLGAGIPLDRALALTGEHAAHEGLATVLEQVRASVRSGSNLADALSRHPRFFPSVMVAMVATGEASGALEAVFTQVADHLEETAELRSQTQQALIYPALMALVASIGVAVLLLFVVPRFSTMLEEVGGELPLTTRVLVAAGHFVAGWWWLLMALAAAAGYGLYRLYQDAEFRGRWHAARLEWMWLGDFERKYATARFARTLGLLLRAGVSIITALRIARSAMTNTAIAAGVDRAAATVAGGGALAPALAGTLPPLAIQMLAVGEESGQLEDMCLRVAGAYDREVRRTLQLLVRMIEPAMILIFGALVGFVALAMLQAIYSINTTAF